MTEFERFRQGMLRALECERGEQPDLETLSRWEGVIEDEWEWVSQHGLPVGEALHAVLNC